MMMSDNGDVVDIVRLWGCCGDAVDGCAVMDVTL